MDSGVFIKGFAVWLVKGRGKSADLPALNISSLSACILFREYERLNRVEW